MFPSVIFRRCTGLVAGLAIAIGGMPPAAIAQTASQVSMQEAMSNARTRLAREGYSINSLTGAPYFVRYLRSGQATSLSFNIPRRGDYVLVVAGDNDTVDLDVYANQINANDVSFGRTGLISFDVYRTGNFVYDVDMLQCNAGNCGVYAVLLSVSN